MAKTKEPKIMVNIDSSNLKQELLKEVNKQKDCILFADYIITQRERIAKLTDYLNFDASEEDYDILRNTINELKIRLAEYLKANQ